MPDCRRVFRSGLHPLYGKAGPDQERVEFLGRLDARLGRGHAAVHHGLDGLVDDVVLDRLPESGVVVPVAQEAQETEKGCIGGHVFRLATLGYRPSAAYPGLGRSPSQPGHEALGDPAGGQDRRDHPGRSNPGSDSDTASRALGYTLRVERLRLDGLLAGFLEALKGPESGRPMCGAGQPETRQAGPCGRQKGRRRG